ncbi:4-hydroxyphenylpyruvate dioxygenase [Coccidioides immitis H538.4]|uniref:4-hydroxyphenylpyruvate dioxygenase n=1 Tax=Coccidioides immitis H538.4 TaxID=396776 RepID=A0A0J8RUL8_COCIT|nr:4-hydroxyphenylpyruvate dioxygenase [Coccidioides immitis H538.4]
MPGLEGLKPEIALRFGPGYVGFDHVTWYVGNAKQTASYYISRMNFTQIAYKGPENGSPYIASYVVENGDARFVFIAPICGPTDESVPESEKILLREIHEHLTKHGDGVKDIAFRVTTDVKEIWDKAVKHGARPVADPTIVQSESPFSGEIQMATIGAYGDTTHTFINRETYNGPFLPGYTIVNERDLINNHLPAVNFIDIDHCVGNQPWNGVDKAVKLSALISTGYWSVDDNLMCSDYSAMRSIVIASPDEVIKMPLNEPAVGKKRSQIEEEKLDQSNLVLNESVELLQKLNILIDFDEGGYLLQIFAKHVLDRPTVFIEIIQRNNFDGFGAGNFKALFQAFEREQALRGNL